MNMHIYEDIKQLTDYVTTGMNIKLNCHILVEVLGLPHLRKQIEGENFITNDLKTKIKIC